MQRPSTHRAPFRKLAFNFSVAARPTLSALQRSRLLARIAAITCAPTWNDAVFAAAERARIDPDVGNVAKSLRERGFYPPPADLGPAGLPRRHPVRMRPCDACGRIVPPNNLAEHAMVRVCDDCRIEPPHDLDEAAFEDNGLCTGVARTPGVHLDALVEGCDAVHRARETASQRLSDLGLSGQEITILCFLIEGYSSRRIAGFIQRSQTFVCKLQQSAERKLRRSGLCGRLVKFSAEAEPTKLRVRTVDPLKLEAMANRRA